MAALTRRFTGATYTATVAVIFAALFFSPAVLVMSGRPHYGSTSIAFVFSVVYLALAWFSWTRPQLTIASIHDAPPRSK